MTSAQWHRTIATNIDSVFGLVHAAAAHMLTRPAPAPVHTALGSPYPTAPTARGHIVLIASAAGQRGEGSHADYATTKGAIIALTKSLSSELAPHAIYANCVAPGWTHTEMTASVFDDPAVAARTNPTIPLQRPAHVYGDRRPHPLPLHTLRRLHLRRNLQRQRRRRPHRLTSRLNSGVP